MAERLPRRRSAPARRAAWVGLLLGAAPWVPHAGAVPLAPLVAAELELQGAAQRGDAATLHRLAWDPALPGVARGRALWLLYGPGEGAVEREARLELLRALGDPVAELRLAALRAVGARRVRVLEREVLKIAAEDPEPLVRVEALRALRPWSRQGHLYFLERALESSPDEVRAEVLRNLAEVSLVEVPPEMLARVRAEAADPGARAARMQAMQTLAAWGRLDWPVLRDAVADRRAPEAVRLAALGLSDTLAQSEDRAELLLDILAGDRSMHVAWASYLRLKEASQVSGDLTRAVAAFLADSGERNAATEEMAAFLRSRGGRAEFRAGEWQIAGP